MATEAINVRRTAAYLVLLCSAAITGLTALHWHDLNYPACPECDGAVYGGIASGIKRLGLFAPWLGSEVRTYGYPLFISLVSSERALASPLSGYFTPNVAIAQSAIYIAACIALFFVIFSTSRTAAWCSAIGLLCNPFVLNYVPLRLSEGLNASVLVSLAAIACALSLRRMTPLQSCILMFCGGAIAGFAMILRPANLAIIVAWLAFAAFHVWQFGRHRSGLVVSVALGVTIPLLPQFLLNIMCYGVFTPFPVTDLGNTHLWLGALALKYETNLSGVGPLQLFYRNPFISQQEAFELAGKVYLSMPAQGIPTMLAHIFNSVNHEHFFTYPYNLHPWYYVPMNAVNHLMLFAAAGSAVVFLQWRRLQATNGFSFSMTDGLWLLLLLAFILTCGINSVSLPETRFGLTIYCMSGPLAVWGIIKWAHADPKTKIFTSSLCLLYVVAAKLLSDWMLAREICNVAGMNCSRLP